MEIVCFLSLLHQLPKYVYCRQTQALIARKPYETSDGNAFTIGLVSWLAQYAQRPSLKLIYLIGQYVIAAQSESNREVSYEAVTFCVFTELLVFYAKLPKAHLQKHIPNCVMDSLHSLLKTMRA
jgi:hypothetical protein